ncbi:MAG: hypothetical protein B6I38_00850 [Anaerolineaceae bacterium 4572_5.1]|nr:MAG: hypothetical protein B6I38_00850 [Anaerolineaceae bacterium 4572_5.1]RLD09282.1 MAG: hypothetical protein DRI56_04430 [Chloroflexota bacterium]
MKPKLQRIAIQLTNIELWIVSLFVAGSLLTRHLFPWTLIVFLFFGVMRWIAYGFPTVPTPVDSSILLLIIILPISFWVTAFPKSTYIQAARLLIGILFFYTLVNWITTRQRLWLVIVGVILAGAGLSLFALISVEWQTEKLYFLPSVIYERFSILVSDTSHSNVMGGNVALLVPFGPILLLFAWQKIKIWEKVFYGFSTLFMISILILTQSRGALIGLITSIPFLIALRWKKGWIVFPSLSVIMGLILWRYGLTQILNWASANVKIGGVEGRIEIWSRGLAIIRDFPFTGSGMGSFTEVTDLLYPFVSFENWKVPHAHNLFLQIAVDVGIPGLIAWISVLSIIILSAWQIYHHGYLTKDNWARGLGAAILSSQVILLVHGIVDDITWGVRPEPILWALWGITIAAGRVFSVTKADFIAQTENNV